MADANNNGENYESKNKWVWAVILVIAISAVYVMSKIFTSGALAVSVVIFSFLSNSLNLL